MISFSRADHKQKRSRRPYLIGTLVCLVLPSTSDPVDVLFPMDYSCFKWSVWIFEQHSILETDLEYGRVLGSPANLNSGYQNQNLDHNHNRHIPHFYYPCAVTILLTGLLCHIGATNTTSSVDIYHPFSFKVSSSSSADNHRNVCLQLITVEYQS